MTSQREQLIVCIALVVSGVILGVAVVLGVLITGGVEGLVVGL